MEKTYVQEVIDAFSYDPETGIVAHRNPSDRVKYVNGILSSRGYIEFNKWGVSRGAQWIGFVIMERRLPSGVIDHINRVKTDNRWSNLRDVSISVNNSNVSSTAKHSAGLTGVRYRPSTSRKWPDRVTWDAHHYGKYLGSFKTLLDAAAARISAANEV